MSKDSGDAECQAYACSLQTCLNKNTYSPDKCESHMRALYQCCARMYDTKGDDAQSTACAMPSATRMWLKKHSSSS